MVLAVLAGLLQAARPSVAPISDTVLIDGAGTRLFLELRGAATGPILLQLHGGPGNAIGLVVMRAYAGPALESHALVAYLHQRGVLRSPRVADSAMTIANHVGDVARTVDYLVRRFPGRPIFLVGHSWGGYLALHVALERPEHVAGVIAVSAPLDLEACLRASYDASLAWAKRANKTDAVKALTALGPPPYTRVDQQTTLSEWASGGNGGIAGHLDPKIAFGRAPYLAPDPAWTDAQMAVTKAMLPELYRDHLPNGIGTTKIPLLLIDGSRDLIVPPACLRSEYARWGGPKSLVELTNSHHLPFVDEPTRFVQLVTAFSEGKPVH